ncbi:MAG: 50S ribosomal protein L15 [Deltaproteobacteria bacterium]|nr:50S ribosomal protein L15 [Deltaproteobacteria bacterium]MBW2175456.1 50S ribosomal protein L15 [Deltaproteobacteria bacterium]MBW2297298.1 50S ribosomal protein L15 [Deltaproteobacteria bacterium]MBW2613956.1 50S ribosomal protein L15 [Deltaproteobacteria bacterium]MBW2634523.1 50S ribosomal protein L15 [Deltaproteobacteria bacterium]
MKLNELSPPEGSRKNRKRKGRGVASGTGKTGGRGSKGHNSRSGGGVRPGFEGGQMPIHRRLPKRGFTNIFADRIATINIRDLNKFESGSVVDEVALVGSGLVKGARDGIKLLGQGEIDFPLSVKVNRISATARKKIEAVGGNVEVV